MAIDDEVPTQGIYMCPVHGAFVHALDGVVLKSVACPMDVPNIASGQVARCGRISPLAGMSEIDKDSRPVQGLDPEMEKALRESIEKMRVNIEESLSRIPERREFDVSGRLKRKHPQYADKFGGPAWLKDWDGATPPQTANKKQEHEDAEMIREMHEVIERAEMRKAMDSTKLNEEN